MPGREASNRVSGVMLGNHTSIASVSKNTGRGGDVADKAAVQADDRSVRPIAETKRVLGTV